MNLQTKGLVNTNDTNGCEIVHQLKQLGAKKCDGECSVQALIPLKDGRYLRIGVTDDDVTDTPGLWMDFYGRWDGLPFKYDTQQHPFDTKNLP